MDQMTDRQVKILEAIIRTYLETGEPVGSRTISKYSDLNLSSATIRNEMSDLEDMGYIVQPHTSAGRIPSDKGYRFYVDNLIQEKDRQITEMKEFVIQRTAKMEQVLKNVAKVLAVNTNYATMISAPNMSGGRVKFTQLSAIEDSRVLAVVVMDNNIVKNKVINLSEPINNEELLKLNILLNSSLNGLMINQINLATITALKEQAGMHSDIINNILDAISESFKEDEELEVYTSGATNIFKYPELADSQKASELISAFEEKKELKEFLAETMADEENTGIQIYIGNESPVQKLKDCSVVTATYDLGGGMQGTIGIVGPKRMDYENVMDNLKTLKTQLDGIFKNDD